MMRNAFASLLPQKEAHSNYVAVNHRGTTYHLFNAKKMAVGRIAEKVAILLRGKHRPDYVPNKIFTDDKCIIVNIDDPYMTGKKRLQKLYRHHTGYPGGLKEYTFKTVVERNPERIINDAVKGMLPKNKLRNELLERLVLIRGPYHNYHKVGLPQFVEHAPVDIPEFFGQELTPENATVYFHTGPDFPEHLKDVPQKIDPSIGVPLMAREKTHRSWQRDIKIDAYYRRSPKNTVKLKEYK